MEIQSHVDIFSSILLLKYRRLNFRESVFPSIVQLQFPYILVFNYENGRLSSKCESPPNVILIFISRFCLGSYYLLYIHLGHAIVKLLCEDACCNCVTFCLDNLGAKKVWRMREKHNLGQTCSRNFERSNGILLISYSFLSMLQSFSHVKFEAYKTTWKPKSLYTSFLIYIPEP